MFPGLQPLDGGLSIKIFVVVRENPSHTLESVRGALSEEHELKFILGGIWTNDGRIIWMTYKLWLIIMSQEDTYHQPGGQRTKL